MYRHTDPDTSYKAAMEMIESGKVSERRGQVLLLVAQYPGHTHGELAALMYSLHRPLGILCCSETPHKRLPELESLGLVHAGPAKRCHVTGKEARTWYYGPALTFSERLAQIDLSL